MASDEFAGTTPPWPTQLARAVAEGSLGSQRALVPRIRMTLHLSARHRLLLAVLAISTLVGLVGAKLNTSGHLQVATASTHVFVDFPAPSIVDRRALPQDVSTLQKRAELYGRLIATPPVLEAIGRRAGLPPDQISGSARTTAGVPIPLTEPGSELRASQIRDSQLPYRLELQSSPSEPILAIYSQAPTTAEAERLANASTPGLQDFLRSLARRQGFAERKQGQLRQLGNARGGVVHRRTPLVIGGLTFMVAFGLTLAILLGLVHLRRRRTEAAAPGSVRKPCGRSLEPLDDWPRTTRVLPWLLAGFIAMLWLTPFDRIELAASTPIDLKLDRLVLPFLVGAWLLSFVAGGKAKPRLRITGIHLALGAFVALAFLSVVLDAHYLNQTLEFDLSLKKLPLLVSYVSLFVIVASSVRRTEVGAFMTYTLVLAVICGVGIIWEYRFKTNLFSIWSGKLLPGGFRLNGDLIPGGGADSLGRRWIVGPTAVGVEAVSILSMALAIALVRLLGTSHWRQRILYGLAASVLVAATFATFRKSALLAPVSVILTLAYFRRRDLLKLAPVGLVIAVMVNVLSPGSISSTIRQFLRPDRAVVPTTSDRTADYDAVRPDLWTHVLFGRGFGSYNHETYRILDSEILGRTVETGVIGLVAFLMIGLSVVFVARKTIAHRDPRFAPAALIGTAAAVCFLVVSTLYDVLAFPHAPYVFLYMAGLVAVAVGRRPAAPSRPPRDHAFRERRMQASRAVASARHPKARAR
jgi:putative inorganic carbon (hco3(-)) transporter